MTTTPAAPKTSEKKPKKPQGPIRWEAVIPFLIVVAVIYLYFLLFFDAHVRRGLEYIGTRANGAEVNIANVKTSFWTAALSIQGIEVTDVEFPSKNKIQIQEIRWKMLWDALLRGKIAIDQALIENIQAGAPRKKPGYVLPVEPPSNEPSQFEKLKDQTLANAEKEFSQNVFGDAAALLGGADPNAQLQGIEQNLKSSLRIKELEVELKKKEEEWKKRIENLPKEKDLQVYNDRVKALKFDMNNPVELQKNVQEAANILREADAKVKEVQGTSQALGSDLNTYQNTFKDLEKMVQQDIKDLEGRLKIPKIDVESLSRILFGPQLLAKVRKAEGYMNKAREYIPPPKTAAQRAADKAARPTPHERAKGKNYQFGRPNSYPLFWMRQGLISSKAVPGAAFSGDVKGELKDLTTDQVTLGRPTKLIFDGNFPEQQLKGVHGELTIDHRTDTPVETLLVSIASLQVNGQTLVNSPDVEFGFAKAEGKSQFKAQLSGSNVEIALNNEFQNIDYQVKASQPILDEMLKGVVKDVPRVTLDAGVGGTWSDLAFRIDTNLGRELAKGFERQIQAKIAEARAKIKAIIDQKIGPEKDRLMGEFNKIQDQIKGTLKKSEAEVNKAKNSIEQSKSDAEKQQKGKLENEAKKGIEDLKKKFGF